MHRIGVLFLLATLSISTMAADSQSKAFPDEATLRQRLGIDPHSKLVLRGRDGSPVDIKTFLGTISSNHFDHELTVVNFFFYECTGCIAEIPALNAFHAAHPEAGALAITYDAKEGLAAFRKKYGLQWEIVTDAVSFFDKANIAMYPTLGIVDRKGRLLDLQGSWTLHPSGRKLEADDLERWVASVKQRQATRPR
jgi:thiol-disulfide isomerase/thioredoxin